MQFTTIADPLNRTDGRGDFHQEHLPRVGTEPQQGGLHSTMLHAVLRGSVPLPAPTRADRKLMHHMATLMHSSTSHGCGMAATLLPGCLFLKTPRVIVHATASQSPLFLGEAEVVAIATGHPILLLRRSADGSSPGLAVDVALPSPTDLTWFLDYHLFRTLSGDSWLVPLGCGTSIHLMRHGLFPSDHHPFTNDWDRDAGLERASAYLASHRIGGWSW